MRILLLTFCLMPLFGEVPEIELKTEKLVHFESRTFGEPHLYDGRYIYFNGWNSYRIDETTLEVQAWNRAKTFSRYIGRQGDKFLARSMRKGWKTNDAEAQDLDIYVYDPETESRTLLPGVFGGTSLRQLRWLYHYYDEYYLGSISGGDDNYMVHYMYNNSTGERLRYGNLVLLDLSPDKLTGVFFDNGQGLLVRDIAKRETIAVVEKYKGRDIRSLEVFYLSSNLWVVAGDSNKLSVYNTDGELVSRFIYQIPDYLPSGRDIPAPVRYTDYVFWADIIDDVLTFFLAKADSVHDHLNDLDLLFTPTTGTCNDSRVRIREWPLLPAKTLGHLETRDEIEILDQSGIKVKIDDMEEYWYKIRRKSDGLEGWSYGAFIDFDE